MITAINQDVANYTKWIRRMAKDQRLLATHISLYTAYAKQQSALNSVQGSIKSIETAQYYQRPDQAEMLRILDY
jgi:hypothetical protein